MKREQYKHIEQEDLDDKLLTIEQVAASLSVCTKTVRRLVRREELPQVRIGRCVRFRLSDVKQILAHGL